MKSFTTRISLETQLHRLLERLKNISIEDYTNENSRNYLVNVIRRENAALDAARKDFFANVKVHLIFEDYLQKCRTAHQFKAVTHLLGEEDLNLTLLVNVENMIRKKEKLIKGYQPGRFILPSLHSEIKAALKNNLDQDAKYEKLGEINSALQKYVKEKGRTDPVFLYNNKRKAKFQLEALPAPVTMSTAKNFTRLQIKISALTKTSSSLSDLKSASSSASSLMSPTTAASQEESDSEIESNNIHFSLNLRSP